MANAYKQERADAKAAADRDLIKRFQKLASNDLVGAIKGYRSAAGCSLVQARKALGR